MLQRRLTGWVGGTALGVAAAGAAAVLAQPQVDLGRDAAPVEKPAVVNDFSEAFRAAARQVTPAVVSIEARTTGRKVEGQTQFEGRGREARPRRQPFGGLVLPPGLENDPRFERFFEGFGGLEGLEGGDLPRRFGGGGSAAPRQAQGSGVIIDAGGVVLTNSHVVADAEEVVVRLTDGREFVATEIHTDPMSDVAVVRIPATGLPTAPLGSSAEMQTGDWVLAVGSPFGLETTVTAGIISAKDRGPGINDRESYLQTDAAINPGNSGGPLVNLNGQVVGINTAISSRGGGNDGVGFAVPIDMARWIVGELLEDGKVDRSYLGVSIQPVTNGLAERLGVPAGRGVLVNNVFPDTPAAGSDLKVGDVIVEVDGKSVTSAQQLQTLVERLEAGKEYPFTVLRGDDEVEVGVTVATMPTEFGRAVAKRPSGRDAEPKAAEVAGLGLEVSPMTADVRERLGYADDVAGVVITRVESGSPAERAGLEAGVVIERVGQTPVDSVDAFQAALAEERKAHKSVLLLVRTPEGGRFLSLKAE